MAVEVLNRQRLARIDRQAVAELVNTVLVAIGRDGAGLTVVFVRDRAMRNLNRRFRGQDRTTDVLSFPSQDEASVDELRARDEPEFLGDVAVSVDRAQQQAIDAHSLDRELRELIMHGVLHLCGYDHETDRGEMNRLELRLRKKLLKNDA